MLLVVLPLLLLLAHTLPAPIPAGPLPVAVSLPR